MSQFNSVTKLTLALRNPPLTLALIGAVILPFIFILALTGTYAIQVLEQHTRTRMEEDIELIARAIRLPLSHALERGHEVTVEQALESAFSINRVYGVYVYDEKGKVVYTSGRTGAEMPSERAQTLAEDGQRRGEFAQAGTVDIYSYFVPLTDSGERVIGLLQLTRRGSDFDHYLQNIRVHGLSVLIISGLLLTGVILLGQRLIVGRPLQRINAGLERIRQGHRDYAFAAQGPAELVSLSRSLNRMLNSIDASHQRLNEQQKREEALKDQLYQSQKLAAIGQLAAGVAHELGSPLAVVDGKAQRLLRQPDLPEKLSRDLNSIRTESARMERIIRQLLDYGRSNPLDLKPVAVEIPIRSALNTLLASQTEELDIELELAPELESLRLNVDRIRLEQALINLLHNACQAASSRVVIRGVKEDSQLLISFSDDGEGFDETIRSQLFEPFFTTKPTGQGTGLGLAVAHAAARDHKGSIKAQSNGRDGACFTLILPIDEPRQHEPTSKELTHVDQS
ncbi:ATP-binding protein [Marinobacterium lutimaris]|uniref:histidine kinase n=1 Tax=Marinobacterium lutimaris TaxID=568106 RepID=A0A1H6CG50_9GAMM|nr:ATP-binding protein [Marinobacterium lutimaris]SEG71990.1 HAMP domain-containing protein [Marinobacterium lutimaris]